MADNDKAGMPRMVNAALVLTWPAMFFVTLINACVVWMLGTTQSSLRILAATAALIVVQLPPLFVEYSTKKVFAGPPYDSHWIVSVSPGTNVSLPIGDTIFVSTGMISYTTKYSWGPEPTAVPFTFTV